MKIEQLRLKNFKVFKKLHIEDLPDMVVFVGANGSGKSTLFDVFGFLRDALTHNVRQALQMRGGFKEVVSRGSSGDIEIEIKFRQKLSSDKERLVTYFLSIGLEEGQPIVTKEILKYKRKAYGSPFHFLEFSKGEGYAIRNEEEFDRDEDLKREHQKLDSKDILALKGLGQFKRFIAASAFRKLIENWHVSDFHISAARPSQEAGYAEHLSQRGENAALVAQYLYESHPDIFSNILDKMKERVPGVEKVEAAETDDGRIILKFQDGAFKDPFIARFVSDGTIKMFAYLLLLYDPSPHPLLCVEEPENQLYPDLMVSLAEEFRMYAERGGQVLISTHSPDFLNGVELDEVFWLTKKDGYTSVIRANKNQLLVDLYAEGDLTGALWKQGLFNEKAGQ